MELIDSKLEYYTVNNNKTRFNFIYSDLHFRTLKKLFNANSYYLNLFQRPK